MSLVFAITVILIAMYELEYMKKGVATLDSRSLTLAF